MGLFDTVRFKCRHCSTEWEEQTKADVFPYQKEYTPETAPPLIKAEISESPPSCPFCQKLWSSQHEGILTGDLTTLVAELLRVDAAFKIRHQTDGSVLIIADDKGLSALERFCKCF